MRRIGTLDHSRRYLLTLAGLAFVLVPAPNLLARAQQEIPERILSIVQADPRVRDILADVPEIRLEPEYSADHGVWIIHFVHADQGPKGLISVSAEGGAILEFSFDPDRRQPEDERAEERESELLRSLLPRFGGMNVAWLSFVLVVVTVGRFGRVLSLRNFDILLLYALAPFLHITWTHTKLAYTGIFVVTVLLFVRCLWGATGRGEIVTESNPHNPRAVWVLLAFALVLHVVTLSERGIGDVGIWSAVGGEYLLRTGRLPYGTEFGPNCVYGPLMYVLFAPAGWAASFIREVAPDGSIVLENFGNWQAMRGVQTTELLLDLLALLALYRLARRQGEHVIALTVVFVYAISPYLIGMTSELGLERASHIAGAPFILIALLLLGRPLAAGLLLGIATGMLYYPLFLAPLWFGYLRRKESLRHGLMFLAGFVAVGVVCVVMLMVTVKPADETQSALGAFIDDTIAQQQFKSGYGDSPLSFWGQYPTLAVWGKPTVGVVYGLFCLALAFFPRRIDFTRLMALTAAVLVGTQLVLSFAGGTYIGFYLAPLVLTLLHRRRPASLERPETQETGAQI